MGKTHVAVQGEKILINNKLTYSEIENSNTNAHGLLMNARFIQGIFDDKFDRERYNLFTHRKFDPDKNTDDLIAALPEWYAHGLRAFTVGLQGGAPVFTIDEDKWKTIDNNPYSEDGNSIDSAYLQRLDRLVRAADEIGMVVIVSLFYQGQALRMKDGFTIRNAVKTASQFLKENHYTNVIIEIANEFDLAPFRVHPLINTAEGMASLIDLAKEASGGMLVGSSACGGRSYREVNEASDIILIHANDLTRQEYYNLIKHVREENHHKPIVCNEDSPCIGMIDVAFRTGTSWGYYNNLMKQEPPADWRITAGEDTFFARRIAEGVGIKLPELAKEEQYYLQGFEEEMNREDNKRWIRLASLYPETINYVEFFRNGELVDIAYNEPFMIKNHTTWIQSPWIMSEEDKEWKAVIYFKDGETMEKKIKPVIHTN